MFGYNLIDALIILGLVGVLFSPYDCGAIAGGVVFGILGAYKIAHWLINRNKLAF
ncbi:MAG: hypothetical protein FWC61_03490 [Proteobacteria bacterium]|nr:hypothetical protein [Pseudomonadota bacterium]